MIKMNKKTTNIAIIILLVAIMILASFLFFEYNDRKKPTEKKAFPKEPENWIYDNPSTLEKDAKIDLFRATEGKVRARKQQQDHLIDGDLTSFFYKGMYKGHAFDSEYLPENFWNKTSSLSLAEKREKADSLSLMRITNEFNPSDRQINGFILAKQEKQKLIFYIFIDQDWKDNLEHTNILWGDDLRDPYSLNQRQFDFSKEKNGIYIDKIETDVDWYKQNVRKGGIIVGEINQARLSKLLNQEYLNITYMMVR